MTYNGQLHVEGAKLMNEHDEEIQLKGCVLSSATSGIYTKEVLTTAKNWGVNIIRLGLSTTANNSEEISKLYEIIDMCIDLDLYVDIIYWNSGDINQNLDIAKEYFSEIALRYKSKENIIYEICNEPTVGWNQIKLYAEEIIPIIRKYNSNSIILVATPDACSQVNVVIDDKLNYENLMYVKHYYTTNDINNVPYATSKRDLNATIENDVPIFISEWSAGSADGISFNIEDANRFAKIINKHNLSYCYYNLFPGELSYCMIKSEFWQNISNFESLTDSGKYFISLLNKTNNLSYDIADKTIYNNGASNLEYIWQDNIKFNTQSIIFQSSKNIPNNVEKIYNLSKSGSGDITAYVINNNNNMYDIIITSDNTIYFYSLGFFFNHFEKLEQIIFDNIDTSYTTNMQYMFNACYSLRNVNLNNFDTSSVTDMTAMFSGNHNLTEADLRNFNMQNVNSTQYMFLNCNKLELIDFSNALIENISNYNGMFAGSNPTVIVKNDEIKNFILNIKNTLKIEVSQ